MKNTDNTLDTVTLSKVIDIALNSMINNPPKNFEQMHIDLFLSTYNQYKEKLFDSNLSVSNLKQIKKEVLTYFQEGSGHTVDVFWKSIKLEKLEVKRENMLKKILKKEQIHNQAEYDFTTDVIVAYKQEGIISDVEVQKINSYLEAFENKTK